MKKISITIPSYNEEKNIFLVYERIKEVFIKEIKKYDFEIIFVNDGSSDNTWEEIRKLSRKDKRVKGINFSKNFGHAIALQAGIENIDKSSAAVVMMDGDLQHPPHFIKKLIDKWESGFDIINTLRVSTESIGIVKKITSALFYKTMNCLSSIKMNPGEADFRLLDRKVVNIINSLPEKPKFYRGLVNWVGFNVAVIKYKADKRLHGSSSYTFRKMFELARMGLASFSMRPLKIIMATGILISIFSTLMLIVMLVVKFGFDYNYFSNLALLVIVIAMAIGLIISFQGVMAVYLIDIYNASKNRPAYIIKDKI